MIKVFKLMALVAIVSFSSQALALEHCSISFTGFKTLDYKPLEQPILFDPNVCHEFDLSRERFGVVDQYYGLITGKEWLDQQLLRKFVEGIGISPEFAKDYHINLNQVTLSELTKVLTQKRREFEEERKELLKDEFFKQFDGHANSYCGFIYPTAKTNKFISFEIKLCDLSYGSPHASCSSDYLTVDVDRKKVITLDQVVSKENHSAIKQALWFSYEKKYSCGISYDQFYKKTDFQDFFFKDHDLVFSFDAYSFGCPYSMGRIELELELNSYGSLINKDFVDYNLCLP